MDYCLGTLRSVGKFHELTTSAVLGSTAISGVMILLLVKVLHVMQSMSVNVVHYSLCAEEFQPSETLSLFY